MAGASFIGLSAVPLRTHDASGLGTGAAPHAINTSTKHTKIGSLQPLSGLLADLST
jgi:hypothetical protein